MQQRSEAWYQARAGRITGSRFSRAMANKRSDTYQSLITDLAEERRTGRCLDRGYVNSAMQWGIDHEPNARRWYCREHARHVDEVAFVIHPIHDFVGVSPDGLVGADGLVEIKCPQLTNFKRIAASHQMPSRYRWQVQGQLWVCERQWLDFVCFYPPGHGVVIHVEADEDDFDQIEARCIEIDREVTRRAGIGVRSMQKSPALGDSTSATRSGNAAYAAPVQVGNSPSRSGVPGWVWWIVILVALYWIAK